MTGRLPVLGDIEQATLVEVVAAESGRVAALLAGDLPHPLVEALEEAGVELLPYGVELGSECTCDAWVDPCEHALAVFTQLAWLIRSDPFVLLHLRGLSREVVLARLHALTATGARSAGPGRRDGSAVDDRAVAAEGDALGELVDDLAVAEEAALRAARELDGPDRPADPL